MTEEELEDLIQDVEFDHYDEGPDEKDPESALEVQVGGGGVDMREWNLTPEPDDPAYAKDWEERPFLLVQASSSIEELFSGKHRGSYSGDEGWDLGEVLQMSPKDQKEAIINIAISYLAYWGGSESMVADAGEIS